MTVVAGGGAHQGLVTVAIADVRHLVASAAPTVVAGPVMVIVSLIARTMMPLAVMDMVAFPIMSVMAFAVMAFPGMAMMVVGMMPGRMMSLAVAQYQRQEGAILSTVAGQVIGPLPGSIMPSPVGRRPIGFAEAEAIVVVAGKGRRGAGEEGQSQEEKDGLRKRAAARHQRFSFDRVGALWP